MTRSKEMRRINAALAHRNEAELRWALAQCELRKRFETRHNDRWYQLENLPRIPRCGIEHQKNQGEQSQHADHHRHNLDAALRLHAPTSFQIPTVQGSQDKSTSPCAICISGDTHQICRQESACDE